MQVFHGQLKSWLELVFRSIDFDSRLVISKQPGNFNLQTRSYLCFLELKHFFGRKVPVIPEKTPLQIRPIRLLPCLGKLFNSQYYLKGIAPFPRNVIVNACIQDRAVTLKLADAVFPSYLSQFIVTMLGHCCYQTRSYLYFLVMKIKKKNT